MSNKNFGISGKGYYIALILCAAAIGITGYWYYQNSTRAKEVSLQEPMVEQLVLGTQSTSPTTSPTRPAIPKPFDLPEPTAEESTPRKPQTVSPVSGETLQDYAMECLSYNETTRDWRTHNGIDLAAPAGSDVCAAADGTVYKVLEDDSLGTTVILHHEGGYTTTYSNLEPSVCVQPGERVKMGQAIGTVGNSALLETALDSHVHFSVSHQERPIPPEDFLN